MTGKYKDYNIDFIVIIAATIFVGLACLGFICGIFYIGRFSNIDENRVIVVITGRLILFILICVEFMLLPKGSFTADENYVLFKLILSNYKFRYDEIMSAKVMTGITHGFFPRVKLILTLKNGKTKIFRDYNFPDEALSTPEKHKMFLDYHPFTFLCNYINERAREYDSSI